MGRGAVNQKGPQAALLAALHAIRGAGKKLPVNLVLVAEGEEEIGSPHFRQVVRRPEVQRRAPEVHAASSCPRASQDPDGGVTVSPGRQGRGRAGAGGQRREVGARARRRTSTRATARAWTARPSTWCRRWHAGHRRRRSRHRRLRRRGAARLRRREGHARRGGRAPAGGHRQAACSAPSAGPTTCPGARRWSASSSRPPSTSRAWSAGYTGPGGKTVLPHRAVAKLDLRLVPDMTFDGGGGRAQGPPGQARLRRHRGQPQRRLRSHQHAPPTRRSSARSSPSTDAAGLDPVLWPRNAGSYPGCVFTGEPLKLPAGHFGLGHGGGAHAPDEYYVIESANPKVSGWDGAVRSFVDYLHELATV